MSIFTVPVVLGGGRSCSRTARRRIRLKLTSFARFVPPLLIALERGGGIKIVDGRSIHPARPDEIARQER